LVAVLTMLHFYAFFGVGEGIDVDGNEEAD
jgi:hypothetical protein